MPLQPLPPPPWQQAAPPPPAAQKAAPAEAEGMLNEEGDAEEEEVDPLDAFMAAEVLPEVKAREEEERKKAAEERAKLQELLKVRCACFGGHALGADVGRRGCVWGPCVVSWMLGLLGMLRLPMAGCCAAMPHLCGYECGSVCVAGWLAGWLAGCCVAMTVAVCVRLAGCRAARSPRPWRS